MTAIDKRLFHLVQENNRIMNQISKPRRIIGWILVGLVGASMIAGAVANQFILLSADDVKKMGELHKYALILSIVQGLSGLLMVVPRTSSLGILLATAYFGGAICFHITHNETSMSLPAAVVMAMLWTGAYLKDPRFLASFHPQQS